jgi:hypothetical protein
VFLSVPTLMIEQPDDIVYLISSLSDCMICLVIRTRDAECTIAFLHPQK